MPPGLVDAYEQLRPASTTDSASRRDASLHGFGTLVRRGMAAWMHACAAVTPPPGTPLRTSVSDTVQLLPTEQRNIVDVIAAMALRITSEVST